MNQSLLQLYSERWPLLQQALDNIRTDSTKTVKPGNPLLLSILDEKVYREADIRIMFFGQEANGWYDDKTGIVSLQESYIDFIYNGKCFEYGKAFWRGVREFLDKLQQKYPKKKIEFVYNNIVKIGKYEGMGHPPEYQLEVENALFSVISREIKILQPDICLFLSGPYRDDSLRAVFKWIEFEPVTPYSEWQLSKLKIEGVDKAFRTYHPNYLWRSKNLHPFFDTIISLL